MIKINIIYNYEITLLKDKNNNKIMSISNNILDENMCYNCNNMIDCYHCYDCNQCKDCDLLILCNHCTKVSFLKNISNYDATLFLDYCNENLSNDSLLNLYNIAKDIEGSDYSTGIHTLEKLLSNDIHIDKNFLRCFLLGFKEIINLLIHIYKFPKELFPIELI